MVKDTVKDVVRPNRTYFVMILQILYIVLWSLVYGYILKLEATGCACSKGWKRIYIKYYVLLMAFLLSLRLLGVVLAPLLSIATLICSIFFIFVTYRYIHELKDAKCGCSEHKVRDVLETVNFIQMVLLVFVGTILLSAILFGVSRFKEKRS
jgi:hypothetical protein